MTSIADVLVKDYSGPELTVIGDGHDTASSKAEYMTIVTRDGVKRVDISEPIHIGSAA